MSDSDSENSFQESKLESQKDVEEDEDEEVRRYIMEKIIQANKILQSQEPVNDKRERKLKFKDKLVDLEVPPLEDTDDYKNYFENESNVSEKLSQLHISNEFGQEGVLLSLPGGSCEENKDRKILVERDGKFELLNLQDIESQGFLPSIGSVNSSENGAQQPSPRSSSSAVSGVKNEELTTKIQGSSTEEPVAFPSQSPPNPKSRPNSAANSEPSKGNGKSNHRIQSASIFPMTSTYCLSPRQKELQKRLEQRREKLKREVSTVWALGGEESPSSCFTGAAAIETVLQCGVYVPACPVFLLLDEGWRARDVYGWDENHGYLDPWCKAAQTQ